jgi:uncharacterized lipoprotein YddW (UPF0748 family)
VAVLGLLLATGCQGPGFKKADGPIRAIWVTRGDYKSAQDVQRIMQNCADAGLNTVLFQVRGNGTVYYPSRIEPWSEKYNFQSPGFDPLGVAVQEAHARGLKIQAWVNVMPGWTGPDEPRVRQQLYNAHPDWFWYDAEGRRQPLLHEANGRKRGWYASLNPCLPEVRSYLVGLFQEIASNYDIDGLHMDYIRFPNEPVVAGERIPDYPRDARTLALFKEATGQTPQSNPAVWSQWRADQVTQLVVDIHKMLRSTRPGAVLSSACGSVRRSALSHYQDAERWMALGAIDQVYLMNYTRDPAEFNRRIQPWLPSRKQTRIVPGLSIGDDASQSVAIAQQEIQIARETTGDFCIFAYSSVFGRSAARGAALVPYLRSLAGETTIAEAASEPASPRKNILLTRR